MLLPGRDAFLPLRLLREFCRELVRELCFDVALDVPCEPLAPEKDTQ
jgi:hypothetical protein